MRRLSNKRPVVTIRTIQISIIPENLLNLLFEPTIFSNCRVAVMRDVVGVIIIENGAAKSLVLLESTDAENQGERQ